MQVNAVLLTLLHKYKFDGKCKDFFIGSKSFVLKLL